MNIFRWLFTLGFFVTAGAGAGEIYKWVDENGVVQFTETPPEQGQSTAIGVEDAPPGGPAAAPESVYQDVIEQQAAGREARQQEEALRAEARNNRAAFDPMQCERITRNWNILATQCPAYYDASGLLRRRCPGDPNPASNDVRFISDEERQSKILEYAEVIEFCR